MELRLCRRTFVNGAYNLRWSASIPISCYASDFVDNNIGELRHQLFVGSEARFFMRFCFGNGDSFTEIDRYRALCHLRGI